MTPGCRLPVLMAGTRLISSFSRDLTRSPSHPWATFGRPLDDPWATFGRPSGHVPFGHLGDTFWARFGHLSDPFLEHLVMDGCSRTPRAIFYICIASHGFQGPDGGPMSVPCGSHVGPMGVPCETHGGPMNSRVQTMTFWCQKVTFWYQKIVFWCQKV